MSTIKVPKPQALDRQKQKKEWPVIVYFRTFGLAILGYTLSKVGLSGLHHAYHWTTGIIGAMAGFVIGWVCFGGVEISSRRLNKQNCLSPE